MATRNPYANIPMGQPMVPAYNGGYNPFMFGAFGNYFGMNTGGGVPPASSGFRYRNKKSQLTNQINEGNAINDANAAARTAIGDPNVNLTDTEAAYASMKPGVDVKPLQDELGTLNSDRKSYVANGLASGLPGVISTIAALHDNSQGLKRLNGLNPESYIPQEVRDTAGAATLAGKSAQTADAGQRKADINANTNAVVANAQLTASTPEQVQQIALMGQKNANNAINELGREGTTTQMGRKRYADTLNMNLGNMRQAVKNQIEQQKATLREARSRNRTQLLENIGMTALTMGV